ncbi:MAG: ABC transporter permease [Proteobacteria bacterium]|nr:ABC transporter permease [Pseudomonadota bacterium]
MTGPATDTASAAARPSAQPQPGQAARRPRFRKLRRSKVLGIGIALIAFWVAVAILAPLIAPYGPNIQHTTALANPFPSSDHWFGADPLRRDIFSRIVWGARPVLLVAPAALFCANVVGIAIGMSAGFYGGWVDELCSRVIDVLLSFPKIVLYVVLIASLGPSALNIVVAVILVSSPGIGRLVRGLTIELKTRDFVTAARMRAESGFYIMLVEILPNARGPLIVDFCMRMGYTIIAIGVLGFLGLGLPPPNPDWGGMVREATPMLTVYPYMAIFPSLAIITLVMGFNLVADGLQDLDHGR